MAKMGLLGAIAGLGQGLTQVGTDIMRRRERALEEARRMAEYERRRADQKEDKDVDYQRDIEKTSLTQDRLDARTEATIAARREDKAAEHEFQEKQTGTKFQQSKELAKLKATLQAENDKSSISLREKLDKDDVRSIEYGKPDAQGYAEVIAVTKDGSLRPTGKKVYKPRLDYEQDDEDEGEAL